MFPSTYQFSPRLPLSAICLSHTAFPSNPSQPITISAPSSLCIQNHFRISSSSQKTVHIQMHTSIFYIPPCTHFYILIFLPIQFQLRRTNAITKEIFNEFSSVSHLCRKIDTNEMKQVEPNFPFLFSCYGCKPLLSLDVKSDSSYLYKWPSSQRDCGVPQSRMQC